MELRRPCRRSLDDASVILGYEKSDCAYLPVKLWRRNDPEVRICLVESMYMSVNELQSRRCGTLFMNLLVSVEDVTSGFLIHP